MKIKIKKIRKPKKSGKGSENIEARPDTKLGFFERYLNERNFFVYLILLAAIILSIIPLSRYHSMETFSIPPSDLPYYNHRISIYEQASFPNLFLSGRDLLVFGGRAYYASPYNLVMGVLSLAFPISLLQTLFPTICGILSVLIFSLVLRKLGVSILRRFVICTMLVASPIFIYTFVLPTSLSFSVLVVLFAFYLFIQENKFLVYLSFLVSFSIPSFGMFPVLFLLAAMFYYCLTRKENFVLINMLIALGFVVISSSFLFLPQISSISGYRFVLDNPLTLFVSDLGGLLGFGVFNLLLMFFGALLLLNAKGKHNYLFSVLMILAFLISFYFDSSINAYLNFFVIILASYGLLNLLKLRWTVGLVKSLTIIIIICGLMFSTVSYINRISAIPPSKEYVAALEFLKKYDVEKNSRTTGIQGNPAVISHYSNSLLIQDFGFVTVMDSLTENYPSKERLNETSTLFQLRKLTPTKEILDKYGISYIFITADMKKGLVWSKEDQGLLFILKNDPKEFRIIYFSSEVEIWEYSPVK